MTCRHTRYLPSARYRYPYRLQSRGGNGGKIAGAAAGIFLAASLGAHAAARHHAAGHAPAHAVTVTAAVPVTSGSETAFWQALLADLGAPASSPNLASLDAWLPHEQPWPPLAQWNPLDSILTMPGSQNFNSFGGGLHVQSYPNAAEGAQADALTLQNGNYPLITAALKAGTGLCGNSFASEFATWSGGGYQGVC